MPKDTFYFSHDYNSRTDDKIKALNRKHGMLGYGIFWAIVEDLYNNANALHLDCDGIAFDLRTDKDVVNSIINDFGLFVIDGEKFGSLSVQKRIDERNSKSNKARESAYKRWTQSEGNTNAMQTHSESNTIKEIKGNEIEDKKNGAVLQTAQSQPVVLEEGFKKKIDRKKKFVAPVLAELEKYFVDATKGKWRPEFSKHQAQKMFAHYGGNGWVQNKDKPIVDWKKAADGWILRTDPGDQKIGTTPVANEAPKTENEILREIEFCYQRFLEGEKKLPDLNGVHYKFLQESKKLVITESKGKEFLQKAIEKRKSQLIGSNDGATNRLHAAYCEKEPKFDVEPIKSDLKNLYSFSKRLIIADYFDKMQHEGKINLN